MSRPFALASDFQPAGDQPQAIAALIQGCHDGLQSQVLLGVTGSGKTFTVAQVINTLQRPALIMAPNKTLAAQLYGEFRELFPRNAVEYFVSYYDYYQPEAYVPATDTYIEKDSSINAHIEQMRLSAIKGLLERRDAVVVATVSAIYGLGDPESYLSMMLHLSRGEQIERTEITRRLTDLQYTRNDYEFKRGVYRVRGDVIDVYPADEEKEALRICLFDSEVESLSRIDPLSGALLRELPRTTIYPKTHYATPRSTLEGMIGQVREELAERLLELRQHSKLVEAQRLEQRTCFDLEMIQELGYCSGIENYSRYLSGRAAGEPPPTLFDYLPEDALLVIDESHVAVPQLGAMYRGDRSRKEKLVEYGFRLPSALDNRPLRFDEWERCGLQRILLSATPGRYEREHADQVVEQLVRPTGIVDPQIQLRTAHDQVDDLLSELRARAALGERALVTTLTKRMAEDLSEYLAEQGVQVRYLHSDIDTVERVEILRELRRGVFDVLVGINLLREGLDLPEVSLVAILDADREGYLRSESALVQTMGRAARHLNGTAILYADKTTDSMRRAIDETERRRAYQEAFNSKHGIRPVSAQRKISDVMELGDDYQRSGRRGTAKAKRPGTPSVDVSGMSAKALGGALKQLEEAMYRHAENMEYEEAAQLRDQLTAMREAAFQGSSAVGNDARKIL